MTAEPNTLLLEAKTGKQRHDDGHDAGDDQQRQRIVAPHCLASPAWIEALPEASRLPS